MAVFNFRSGYIVNENLWSQSVQVIKKKLLFYFQYILAWEEQNFDVLDFHYDFSDQKTKKFTKKTGIWHNLLLPFLVPSFLTNTSQCNTTII